MQQAMGIIGQWPGTRPLVRQNQLRWIGSICPSPLSPSYEVLLEYKLGGNPHVHVLHPMLDPGHQERLPHVYSGNELCLFTRGEWNPSMSLAKTTIPWTAEWLFHYELWKATDRWRGGGDVYAPPDRDNVPAEG